MLDKVSSFVNFLITENQKHNLIGKSTIENIWKRHIDDSLQLVRYIEECKNCNNIVDIGSGAGFPIIPIGIAMNKSIILIEKSPVKCEFLKKSCDMLDLKYQIINQFVSKENIATFIPKNSVITSRAFKCLDDILCLVDGVDNILKLVLLKGEKWKEEVADCKRKHKDIFEKWNIDVKRSITNVGVVMVLDRK